MDVGRDVDSSHRGRGGLVSRIVVVMGAVALGLVPGLVTTTAAAADGDVVTWGVAPAAVDGSPPRPNFAYELDPGTVVDDAMVVTNHSDRVLDLGVDVADAFTTESGELDLLLADERSVGVGVWVQPSVDSIRLEPGEQGTLPFTLTVPPDATPGDHGGGIVTTLRSAPDDSGLVTERRLGSRIHVRVAGDLAPALEITDVRVSYVAGPGVVGAGHADVDFRVVNTGNTRLGADGEVALAGPFGLGAVRDALAVPELLPGEDLKIAVRLDDVGPWFRLRADVTLLPAVPGADATIAAVHATAGAWAVPWVPVGFVLALAAVVLVMRLRDRRRLAAALERASRETGATSPVHSEVAEEPT